MMKRNRQQQASGPSSVLRPRADAPADELADEWDGVRRRLHDSSLG